jgi:carbonic anhydrase
VASCSDHRFEQQNREFLRGLGFRRPHIIQNPSGVAVYTSAAATDSLPEGMGLLLGKAMELTGARHVVFLGHAECGGYTSGAVELVRNAGASERPVRDVQIDHLENAGRTISERLGEGVEVSVYYADVGGEADARRVRYASVGRWSGGSLVSG